MTDVRHMEDAQALALIAAGCAVGGFQRVGIVVSRADQRQRIANSMLEFLHTIGAPLPSSKGTAQALDRLDFVSGAIIRFYRSDDPSCLRGASLNVVWALGHATADRDGGAVYDMRMAARLPLTNGSAPLVILSL